ncbi:MAG: radical SAM protein [Phycisphaerales bacterium]|nr:radical SAM protein [Phycisphaerae bacterium]NNF41803.1 radical SAM protein [Phycisphaerales bacterium]NNM24991.1 radical SAM protein [Phycisphaerales bacterium]
MTVATLPNSPVRTDPALAGITDRVERGQRLSAADGRTLYATADIHTVCRLADRVRRRLHADVAYYNVNRHINYSNVCALSCTFCAFHRKKGADGAYEMSIDEVRAEAVAAEAAGATELHIVGGLHPWLPFDYYLDMMRAIRTAAPSLHIKAFTAVELVHLARIAKRGRDGYEGIKSVLRDLRDAGLGSLPGGGAEVFDDRVHDTAFKGKIRAGQWLDVHRAAHELGINSNATMLYGHVEERADRIQHLMMLREQQDRTLAAWAHDTGVPVCDAERHDGTTGPAVVLTGPGAGPAWLPTPQTCNTGYFQTIIPLPFFPNDSALEHLPGPTGLENLRTLAIARLMLDNFPHVKAFWIMQSLEMAQFMLQNGADDIDGTVVWYDITKLDGPTTHQETTVFDLQRVIREAGFVPVERDTLYRPVDRSGT